ncbi:MAG: GLPGLI family protein [Bacteroidia bacterium]
MMNKLKFTLLLFFMQFICSAQQLHFSGKILFERKENIHKQFTGNSFWEEQYRNRMPKYKVDEFSLVFNKNKTLYHSTKLDDNPMLTWFRVASNNIVLNNLQSLKQTNIKEIFDETFLIEDSIPALVWRYHGDYRKIAGYNCRKASTIINDSLYIIAFYADEIPVKAGPESLNGLPGMILGYAIPRLHITCFATKVITYIPEEKEFEYKKPKAKSINKNDFLKYIYSSTKNWGEYAGKVVFKVLI